MKRVLDLSFAWVQNATFFKKLRFGLNQTQKIASFLIYALFGLQKAQTNAHLISIMISNLIFPTTSLIAIVIESVKVYNFSTNFIVCYCD